MIATARGHQTLSEADYGNAYITDTLLAGAIGTALSSLPRVSASLAVWDHRTSHREVPSQWMEPELAPSHYVRSDYSRCTNPWITPVVGASNAKCWRLWVRHGPSHVHRKRLPVHFRLF
jgi:hypothetical protein